MPATDRGRRVGRNLATVTNTLEVPAARGIAVQARCRGRASHPAWRDSVTGNPLRPH